MTDIKLNRYDLVLGCWDKRFEDITLYDFSTKYSQEDFHRADNIWFIDTNGKMKIFKEREPQDSDNSFFP